MATLLPGTELGESSVDIELARIRPNPNQPRRTFDPTALEQLRHSIVTHGVLQPIVLRPSSDGYEIISGERRWRASRMAGLATIPAVVREGVTDAQMLELALVENVQREDLNAIERARGFQRMVDELGLTQEGIAEKVGLKRSTVANHLRLLELPDGVQEAVARGGITMGHARALLGLDEAGARVRLTAEILAQDLSVRQVEELVRQRRNRKGGTGGSSGSRAATEPQPWAVELQNRLRTELATKVRVESTPKYRGRLVIEFFNRADLDRLCERLAPKQKL